MIGDLLESSVVVGAIRDWSEQLAARVEHWRALLPTLDRPVATVDFESRSTVPLPGPKGSGAWAYSQHPDTEVLCLAYLLPGYDAPEVWHCAHPRFLIGESPAPVDLFAFVLAGGLVEAHNAFFERAMWANVMVPRYGWPEVPEDRWRCSAAKASASALPRGLDEACRAMGLPVEKDMEGNALMRRMCKPRQMLKSEIAEWCEHVGWEGRAPGKKHPDLPTVYHESEGELERLWTYCAQDVVSEEVLSLAVPDLSLAELAVWQMDQRMNLRGARFDLAMAKAALKMAEDYKEQLNEELFLMTGVSSGTKRAALREWLTDHEALDLPDTQAETLEWYVDNVEMSGRARRVLEIIMDVNRTSTRKYTTMLARCSADDWRARDLLMYHGANTGRWAGKGIQVHNFPARDLIISSAEFDWVSELICSGDVGAVDVLYGDVMRFLSHALRGAIIPSEGRDLMVADYSAIEARVVLWLAGAIDALGVFERGEDIYCDMATGIYGYDVVKGVHKHERQFGKQAVLGLGYQMGYVTFLLTCRKHGIRFTRQDALRILGREQLEKVEGWVRWQLCLDGGPPADASDDELRDYSKRLRQAARTKHRLVDAKEDPSAIVHELAIMKHTVDVYRSRYPEVRQYWKEQEQAAIAAVRTGQTVEAGRVKWYLSEERPVLKDGARLLTVPRGKFLYCELPSGRRLAYCDPMVKDAPTAWGEMRPALRYMRVDPKTKKWVRTATYGGKLTENITQAVARDIMTNAMLLADEGGVYDTIMSVHDELVCEVDKDRGSRSEFEELMSFIPPWAIGCPIVAEAERYERYRK